MKKKKWLIVSSGFALFSMFFGSGNLVFPITVGQASGGHTLLASLGILLTGVIVPFLGVLGMILYKGDLNHFFSCFGKRGTFLFSLLALSLMGPFGVLARCLTVAHGALLLLWPQAPLPLTSALLCGLIYLFTIRKAKIVSTLGSILTPLLLIAIALIAAFGLGQQGAEKALAGEGWAALKNGFFQGYQTMDLLAAFFFSRFIIDSMRHHQEGSSLKHFYKSSCLGAGLLGLVYVALVKLGSHFSPLLAKTPPQEMLGVIAQASLGPMAAPLVCVAVIFACLTTAIVLASLFADFFRSEIAKNKVSPSLSLGITLLIGFLVSTFDFAGIAAFLCPFLEVAYPALIALTAVNIFNKFWGYKTTHWPFTLAIAAKLTLVARLALT